MNAVSTDLSIPTFPLNAPKHDNDKIMEVATKLEATFLSEMLKSSGLGQASESFGGGVGEDQFSSFLIDMQANQMAKSGGVGLAEHLYHAMKRVVHE